MRMVMMMVVMTMMTMMMVIIWDEQINECVTMELCVTLWDSMQLHYTC